MNNIYTIIVTYNGEKWVNKCIQSLLDSTVKSNIIIVDNNSTDKTINQIKNKFPEIEIITNQDNLGFGKANNIGLKKAKAMNADFVLLLNQDAWVESDCIEKLVLAHHNNPTYFIYSPIHMKPGKNELEPGFSFFIANQEKQSFTSDLFLNKLEETYESEFINAAIWLVTKECLNKIGGFDPLFFHYGEDVDYSNRIKYHNGKICFCPKAIAFHASEPSNQSTQKSITTALNKEANNYTVGHLIELKKLNWNFPYHLFLTYEKLIRSILKSFLKLSFKKVIMNFKILFNITFLIFKLITSRAKCRKLHPNFIE